MKRRIAFTVIVTIIAISSFSCSNRENGPTISERENSAMPLLGDTFPNINVQTTHGKKNIPADYKGKWFILFSHPADFTPVCTTEFIAFQKRINQFKKLKTELIGLSVDQVFSHIKWKEWIHKNMKVKITFPIIADTGDAAMKLGMIHPSKGSNTVRAVFIVDPRGITRSIMYYPQELGRNMDEFVRMVKGLQTADKENVAMPANWPKNEVVGNHGIIPPASDEQTAVQRTKKYDCYDWWFCHKSL
jgi:peroxiredoxin 2/4